MIVLTHAKPYPNAYSVGRDGIKRCVFDDVYYYALGVDPPNYPVPAIDYFNSAHPIHNAIGYMMEWSIPVETQLKFRG